MVFGCPSFVNFLELTGHSVQWSWTVTVPPYFGYGVNGLVAVISAHFNVSDPEAFRLDKLPHVRPKAQGLA